MAVHKVANKEELAKNESKAVCGRWVGLRKSKYRFGSKTAEWKKTTCKSCLKGKPTEKTNEEKVEL